MSVAVVPHLNFRGQAREALTFYAAAVGGEAHVVTNAQADRVERPEEAEDVVFGQVVAPNGFTVMAYDAPASKPLERGVRDVFVSLRGETVEEVTAIWEALADGAEVVEAFGPSQWSPAYGMLVDRFGITWVLDVAVSW
ncbi:VOC family protein [uncultured Nocardioides sp.]|uniref:VOC family protein n=1 Tax=uncultured Nocardioides sp. TaxID=198441 RepID=UPI00261D0A78|nr:VOC family protein [uncultured Nocardioides sp.]